MKTTDKWFENHTVKQKLQILMYNNTWDYDECLDMSVSELIASLNFKPFDKNDSEKYSTENIQNSGFTLKEDMIYEKWDKISKEIKGRIMHDFQERERGWFGGKPTRNDYDIASHMLNYLSTIPIGTEISTRELGEQMYMKLHDDGMGGEKWMEKLHDVIESFDRWWPIDEAFTECVKKDGKYRLDKTKYDNMVLGLPFNIPFTLLKKGQSVHAKESRAAKQFASKHGLYGIRFICYWEDKCVFGITHDPQILIDPVLPPTYIMVDTKLKARFSTQIEGEQIYNFNPGCPC